MAGKIALLVIVSFAAFLGVAQRRANTGKKVWTHMTLLYTLLAAALTLLVLHWLGINP
jgi:hypothetical protein